MNKQDKQELETQATDYARQIHALINEQGGSFEVVIHRTSQTNMTWYYTVNLWYFDERLGRVTSWNLNYVMSQYLGFGKLKDERHLRGSGVGTERGFETIYNLGFAVSKALNWADFTDIKARFGVDYEPNPWRYAYVYTGKVLTTC
jgi:hypothetical protein